MNLHKKWRLVPVLLVLILTAGCNLPWNRPAPAPDQGRVSEAEGLVHEFMTDRLNGRPEKTLQGYLSDTAKEDYNQSKLLVLRGTSNPKLAGYHVLSRSRIGSSTFLFTVALQSSYTNLTYADNTTEDLEVGFFDGKYIITAARAKGRRQVFAKGGRVKLVDEQGAEKDVLTMADLPDQAVPQGAEPNTRFGVGKNEFEALALSADNSMLAFSTAGLHGFIGFVDFTTRKVQNLDVIFEGKAVELLWASRGPYLAAEINQPVGTTGLKVYDTEKKKLLPLRFAQQFPPDRMELSIGRWSDQDNILFFNAEAVGGQENTKEIADKTGRWKIDVETGELTKVSQTPGV